MKAKRAIGITACTAAALVLIIRYTGVLDPDLKVAPSLKGLAEQFHTGGGYCLRYHEGPPNPGEVGMTATMLIQAGLTGEDLGGLVGEFYERARTEELAHHPRAEEDEWIEAIAAGSSPLTRAVLPLKRDRLRTLLTQLLKTDVPKRKLLADLTEPQRKTLDKLWQRNPTLFLVSGLMPLIAKMREFSTRDRLNLIAEELAARVKAGAAPATLEELGLDPRDLRDGWDREIEYEKQEGKLVITALGDEAAKPTTREVPLPSTMPALPQATGCPPPGAVTLKRKDFDDAISNPNSLALAARVVPAIQEGQPVGFKLFAIRPESIFARAGLCNGDLVKAVNGRPLTTAQHALEVYDLVRKADEVHLALVRGGADVTLDVHVR